jgi:hypothetical protein
LDFGVQPKRKREKKIKGILSGQYFRKAKNLKPRLYKFTIESRKF